MFGLFGGGGGGGGRYTAKFRVYPVSFIDKPHLEHGDKVVLPPSALDRLTQLHIQYPMVFEISNPRFPKVSHCGVMEFCAEEGTCYLPYWMMQNLLLSEGDMIEFKSTSLPKATFVKIQPHTTDFLDISDPKAVLETSLRNYACLTKGDTVLIQYNERNYYIDIKEAKPGDAGVSVIETDCEVDFEAPKDYVEPPKTTPKPQESVPPAAAAAGEVGGSQRQGGRRVGLKRAPSDKEGAEMETSTPEAPSFSAFTGGGYKLSSGRKLAEADGAPAAANPLPGIMPNRGGAAPSGADNVAGEEAGKNFSAFKGKANKLR